MVNCSIVKFVCGLIVEVFLVWADGLQQLQDIVWIQSAGLGGHAAGQVWVADVCYSLKSINIVVKKNIKTGFRRGLCLLIKNPHLVNVQFSRPGGLDVAPCLCSQIHHHRAVPHRLHKLLLDQNGSTLPWMGDREHRTGEMHQMFRTACNLRNWKCTVYIKAELFDFWPQGAEKHLNKPSIPCLLHQHTQNNIHWSHVFGVEISNLNTIPWKILIINTMVPCHRKTLRS